MAEDKSKEKSLEDQFKKGVGYVQEVKKLANSDDLQSAWDTISGWVGKIPVLGPFFEPVIDGLYELCESNQYVMQVCPPAAEAFKSTALAASQYGQSIQNASGVMSGFNGAIISSGETQMTLAEQIATVQGNITSTIQQNAGLQGEAAAEGAKSLEGLFTELHTLSDQELKVQTGFQDTVKQRAETSLLLNSMNETEAKNILKSAMDTKQGVIQTAETQYSEELALLSQKYSGQSVLTNSAYADEVRAAQQRKEQAVQLAEGTYQETVDLAQIGYLQQNEALQGSLESMGHIYQQMQTCEKAYIDVKKANAQDLDHQAYDDIDLEEKHNARMAELWGQLTSCMDDETKEQLGILMGMSEGTEFNSELMSGDISQMTGEIMQRLIDLGVITEGSMDEIMFPMVEASAEGSALIQSDAVTTTDTMATEYNCLPEETSEVMDATYDPMIASEQEKGAILAADTQMHTDAVKTDINALPEETVGAMDDTMDPMVEASATKGAQVEGNLQGMTDNSAADLNALPGETSGAMAQVLQNQLNALYGQSGPLLSALFGLTGGITGDVNGMPGEVGDPLGIILTAFVGKILSLSPAITDEISVMVDRIVYELNTMSSSASGIMNQVMSGMLFFIDKG